MGETEIRKVPFGVWILPLLAMVATIIYWMPAAIRSKQKAQAKAVLEKQEAERAADALRERDITVGSGYDEIIIPKGYTITLHPYDSPIHVLPVIWGAGNTRNYEYGQLFILWPDDRLVAVSLINGKVVETPSDASPRWQGIEAVRVNSYYNSPVKVHVRFE